MESGREDRRRQLEQYFESAARARRWDQLYDEDTLAGVIHQDRQALALEWIDRLALPVGAAVLDVGCGAGQTAVALALRGLRVTAIDASAEMVERARSRSVDAGVGENLTIRSGDAENLEFGGNSFRLVIALGVLPFLHSPEGALREFARVTRPGGHVLVSSDNRRRINRLLDPRFNPALSPLKELVKALRRRRGARGRLRKTMPAALSGGTRMLTLRELEAMLTAAGMSSDRITGLGFGPFSFMGRVVLKEPTAIRVHRFLQARAARDVPVIRSVGLQHLVLARVQSAESSPSPGRANGSVDTRS